MDAGCHEVKLEGSNLAGGANRYRLPAGAFRQRNCEQGKIATGEPAGPSGTLGIRQLLVHSRLIRLRDSYYFFGDFFRRKNKINTPACDSTLRHIGLSGCIRFLRDRYPSDFLYSAQRFRTIAVISGYNDGNDFAPPVLCDGAQKYRNDVGPSPGLRDRF